MSSLSKSNRLRIISLYLACSAIVVVYVNMYGLFAYINKTFGKYFIAIVPILIPALFILLVAAYVVKFKKTKPILQWKYLVSGLVFLLVSLAFPDPDIPVKRIHVTEYALLSILVRYTMSYRYSGRALLTYSIIFTCILGIHDEFLQGIHFQRTYGLKDMAVNGLSAIGSGLILHGLGIFDDRTLTADDERRAYRSNCFYLFLLCTSVIAAAVPLIGYLRQPLPLWPFLPIAAMIVYWSCFVLSEEKGAGNSRGHGVGAITTASFLFLLYPILVNAFQITFY